jgi:hypothetical protein
MFKNRSKRTGPIDAEKQNKTNQSMILIEETSWNESVAWKTLLV